MNTEAINIGNIIGAAAYQKQISKSLDYYENDGRGELFEELKKNDGVNNDPHLNAILDNIMSKLSATIAKTDSSITERPYNYFINPETNFNAYCSLGHNVSVNTGVFNFFNNDEERIAVVVAHELVHGQKQHPLKGAKKKLTVDLVSSVVGAELGTGQRLAVDIVAVNAKNTGITKPNEWEADNIAFSYIIDSGYNPGAPAAVWQRVMDNSSGSSSSNIFTDILNPSTHPDQEDRRDNYSKKLTEYSNNKVSVDGSTGEIKINGKVFMKPVAAANMSGMERSYLIAGNLASIYHNNKSTDKAAASNGSIYIGNNYVVQPTGEDGNINDLVNILNEIK